MAKSNGISPDESQKRFCFSKSADVRLLAPAGCGKTLSLLFRCKHLVENSTKRPRFLIVTFTIAARDELLSRINTDMNFASIRDNIEITTLNSWGFRRIKNISRYTKLLSDKTHKSFAVLNQLQSIWINYPKIRAAIENRPYDSPLKLMELIDGFKSIGFDHTRHVTLNQFKARLTEIISEGLHFKYNEYLDELTRLGIIESLITNCGAEVLRSDDEKVFKYFYRFWRESTQHLIESATFTLEDQKYYAYLDERQKLEDGSILSGAARYDHVLVDEFQDINPLDMALIKVIAERSKATLTIVGDDDQALFEWRGATPEYILKPDKYFDRQFDTYTLEINYRSPQNIVRHSQKLIKHNKRREKKNISAKKKENADISIVEVDSINDALDYVYSEIASTIGEGESPSKIAIISRKRSQIIPYQVYFASKDISFCAAEDLQVFLSKAFDRLLNLIIVKSNAQNRQVKTQIVNSALELCDLVKRYKINKSERGSLQDHLSGSNIKTLSDAANAIASYRGKLKGTNQGGRMSDEFANAIREFLDAETVEDTLNILESQFDGLQTDFGKAEDDIFYTDPPFIYLAEYAKRYDDDYTQFIEDIEQAKSQLVYLPPFEDDQQPTNNQELWKRPLHLMTALRAKGKEFDTVILLDVNDGIWPHKKATTIEQLEAERRVFYVAFTRTKKKLIMIVNTRIGSHEAIISPYINELELEFETETPLTK